MKPDSFFPDVLQKSMLVRFYLEQLKAAPIDPLEKLAWGVEIAHRLKLACNKTAPLKRIPPAFQSLVELHKSETVTILGKPEIKRQTPLLFVPSIINHANIIDIHPNRSILNFFQDKGFDCYVLNWGPVSPGNTSISLSHLASEIIPESIDFIATQNGEVPIVIGHCLGGTLARVSSTLYPPKALATIASPIDFHHHRGNSARLWKNFYALPLASARDVIQHVTYFYGLYPGLYFNFIFSSIDPLQEFGKRKFLEKSNTEDDLEIFYAIENWIKSPRDLEPMLAEELFLDWYHQNALIKETWKISGKPISLSAPKIPVLALAGSRDHITRHESAILPDTQFLKNRVVDLGHIGMLTSRNAQKLVYEPIYKFISNIKL